MPKKKAGKKGKKGKKAGKKSGAKSDLPEGYETVGAWIKKEVKQVYEAICQEMEIAPVPALIQFFNKCIEEDTVFNTIVGVERIWDVKAIQAVVRTLLQWNKLSAVCFWRALCGDEGCLAIAALLKANPSVEGIELLDCGVGIRGCELLGDALSFPGGNQTLRYLNLDYNKIGDAGVAALATGLQGNGDLKVLSLKYCNIGDAGAAAIGQYVLRTMKLVELSLQGNQIGTDGLRAMSEPLAANLTVKKLNLSDNQIDGRHGLRFLVEAVKVNKAVELLELDANPIGHTGGELLLELLQDRKQRLGIKSKSSEEEGDENATTTSIADEDLLPPKENLPPKLSIKFTSRMDRPMFTTLLSTMKELAPGKKKKGKKGKKKKKKK